MTSRDFCFWLQGYFEIGRLENTENMAPWRVELIKKHLAMVFAHEIDPSAGPPEHQALLDELHKPTTNPPFSSSESILIRC